MIRTVAAMAVGTVAMTGLMLAAKASAEPPPAPPVPFIPTCLVTPVQCDIPPDYDTTWQDMLLPPSLRGWW